MEPNLQILIVEDERAHAELIRRAFADQSPVMALHFAENILEAQNLLAKGLPDLVISDMLLPDGQGTDLLPQTGEPHFPLVLMTSFGNERMAVESIKAGAVNYVVKSVATMSDLPRIAQHALREWEHITERRRAEEALKLHQERLEELVELRTAELQTANQRLQELHEQKNCYFGVVAHDLRSPLSTIVLRSELILLESDPEKIHKAASKICREATEMNSLIGHFLDIEAIESGNFHTERVPFNLLEIAERAMDRHAGRAKEKDIELRLRFPQERLEPLADPKFTLEVLDNLISNAIKFSPMNRTVTVEGHHQGETIRVSVIDQGPGLTLEDRTRLFERFVRLSAKPTDGERTCGLGLSIVKYMIDTMEGRIWVDSEPGCGAAFRFELPAAKESQQALQTHLNDEKNSSS